MCCFFYNCVVWCLIIVDVSHDCYIIDQFGFIGRTLSQSITQFEYLKIN